MTDMNSSRTLVAGVDEVGRGPLAGPVVAAAVIIDENHSIAGLRDSKRLSERQRLKLDLVIREKAVAFGIGQCEPMEIDEINILEASMRAMQRAVQDLGISPGKVLVDGNRCPALDFPVESIVGGDDSIPAISAASIIAKVYRDELMKRLDREFPEYGFARHKGYPTVAHRAALAEFGPCEIHRKSFAPVRELLMAHQ